MAKITSNLHQNNPFNNSNDLYKLNTNNTNTLKNNDLNNNMHHKLNNDSSEGNILSIPNDEAYTICQRCKQKESVFSCIVCESFKFLCTKCDNYIHSLPSKQAHQRLAIICNKKKNDNLTMDDSRISNKIDENNTAKQSDRNHNNFNYNLNNSLDLNYKFNLSPINRLNNLRKDKENSAADYNTLLDHNRKPSVSNEYAYNENINKKAENNANKNLNSYESVDDSLANINGIKNIVNSEAANKINFMNIQESTNNHSNSTGFNSFKIPNAQSFSRGYVYEIKVIYWIISFENRLFLKLNALYINFFLYFKIKLTLINKKDNFRKRKIRTAL